MTSPPAQDAELEGLIRAAADGDRSALDGLFARLYEELRRLARARRASWARGHTLNTTALVHEAYVKLAGSEGPAWTDRVHFLAVAGRAMQQVLLDYARSRLRVKRGGGRTRVRTDLRSIPDTRNPLSRGTAVDLLALEAALEHLAEENPRQRRVVECRFFSGLTVEETAEALSISEPTVKRDWARALVVLHEYLVAEDPARETG